MRRSGRRRGALLVASLAVVALAVGILVVRGRFIVGSQPVSRVAPDPWTTTITVHSTALDRDMAAQVFLPPNLDPQHRAPVLFLFHGRGGDERSWMAGQDGSGVGVDSVAHGMISAGTIEPLVIVSARIDDSYGVDSLPAADGYDHGPYERYIIEDLVPAIEARYPVGGDPAHRAVGGFSMGAFAALHAALRHPGIFGSVGALSPPSSSRRPQTGRGSTGTTPPRTTRWRWRRLSRPGASASSSRMGTGTTAGSRTQRARSRRAWPTGERPQTLSLSPAATKWQPGASSRPRCSRHCSDPRAQPIWIRSGPA